MKAHKIVLSITGIILIIEIIVYLILFKTGVLSNYYRMFSLILGMIWFFFYPIALYTCYYHIGKFDKKGTFLEEMLLGFAADKVSALLVIPLLIAPFRILKLGVNLLVFLFLILMYNSSDGKLFNH